VISMVLWFVTPCSYETTRRVKEKDEFRFLPAPIGFLLDLLLDPQNRDDTFPPKGRGLVFRKM
jgi:hypothetical protein